MEELQSCRHFHLRTQRLEFSAHLVFALDMVLQRIEHAWHHDKHGNAFAVDRVQDFRRFRRSSKQDGPVYQLRYEHAHELSEDVTQWNQVQESDGMKDALVLPVL